MAKRKKKNPAADKLIDSLMEDLNPPNDESTKTSHEKTSTSIARSADLIRDLETQIASQAQSQAKKPADIQVQETNLVSDYPEHDEDIISALDDSELSPPEVIHLESTSHHSDYEASYKSSDYGSSFDPDKILFDSSNASNNREDVGLPSVSGIFSMGPVEDSAKSAFSNSSDNEDQTVSIQQDPYTGVSSVSSVTGLTTDADKTIAVEGFAQPRKSSHKKSDVDVKVSIGGFRGGRTGGNVMTSVDASLAQAENLRLAQQRILTLEKEVESLRAENDELASAADIIRTRSDEMSAQLTRQEHEKADIQESYQGELMILKGNLQHKDAEMIKARQKVEDLETRLKSDFKKIRVRERELENRLELLRAEKTALVRSKDEYILDLKRKIDQSSTELDNYRKKVLELNRTIDANQEQVKRTERALRLALNNLEAQEENVVPLKKAE